MGARSGSVFLAAVVLTLGAAGNAPVGGQTTMPAAPSGAVLSPEFAAAFEKLASEEFPERQEAIRVLQRLLTNQVRQTIALQQVMLQVQQDLSQQMRALTGRASADAEADARVAGLMEFIQAVSRWAGDCMLLPAAQRDAMLKWGSTDEMMPMIAAMYSRSTEARVQAIREVAKNPATEQVNWLLLQMLNDQDRAASLTAMDVLSNRPPNPEVINALWNRSMANTLTQVRGQARPARTRMVTVAGRNVQVVEQDSGDGARNLPDGDVAADVLIKYDTPAVAEKLDDLFKELGRTLDGSNNSNAWRSLSTYYGGNNNATLWRLVSAYQPKEAVRFLVKAVDQASNDGGESIMNVNGKQERFRMGSKVEFAVMLLRATGQSTEDYGIVRMPNYNPERFAVKGSMDDEAAMSKKVQEWWKTHAKEYGVTVPATQPQPGQVEKQG